MAFGKCFLRVCGFHVIASTVDYWLDDVRGIGMFRLLASAGLFLVTPVPLMSHPGGLAADGCHNDRKNGGRHCHRAPSQPPPQDRTPQRAFGGSTYFPNCTAARQAGAAPVRRGSPGYGPHLDRDGDGIGCE